MKIIFIFIGFFNGFILLFLSFTVLIIYPAELKNICQVEHSRHRSFENFISNLISGLIAYSFFPKKPAIRFDVEHNNQIALF